MLSRPDLLGSLLLAKLHQRVVTDTLGGVVVEFIQPALEAMAIDPPLATPTGQFAGRSPDRTRALACASLTLR